MTTNQDEVRESWNEKFRWMKDHPQLISLYEDLPDWWLANFDTLLAKKMEEWLATIKNSRTVDEKYGIGVKEETARNQVIADLSILS